MDTVWHDDGHVVHLRLERALLVVDDVVCPGDDDRACAHPQVSCLVEWFLERFGLDCHVGMCQPTPAMRMAWTLVGDSRDLDAAQVWVISVDDEAFAAWLVTQRQER